MDARTESIASAVVAGIALGSIVLAARHLPPLPESAAASRAEAPVVETARNATSVSAPPPSAPPPASACPADMTLVEGDFCPSIRYDCARPGGGVTCAEYVRGNRCVEPTDYRRYCVDRHEWPNRVGESPTVYVDWHEAKALCASAGKRLCRRSEWILACEGPKRLPYPWGFVRQPSPCNIDRPALGFDINAMVHEETREGELDRLWQADPIGSHPDCVSAFGVYDMSGNVDEWTDDLADDPHSRHPSTLNGGYWGPVRDTCRLTTTVHGAAFKFYQVGFRCCKDTEDGVEVPPPRPFVDHENLPPATM